MCVVPAVLICIFPISQSGRGQLRDPNPTATTSNQNARAMIHRCLRLACSIYQAHHSMQHVRCIKPMTETSKVGVSRGPLPSRRAATPPPWTALGCQFSILCCLNYLDLSGAPNGPKLGSLLDVSCSSQTLFSFASFPHHVFLCMGNPRTSEDIHKPL